MFVQDEGVWFLTVFRLSFIAGVILRETKNTNRFLILHETKQRLKAPESDNGSMCEGWGSEQLGVGLKEGWGWNEPTIYIGCLVVEEIMVVYNEPSLLPV